MSPRSYGFIWIGYFVAAGAIWLAGILTMVAVVGFGFVAFGLVFMGMMCVLPAMVAHPVQNEEKISKAVRQAKSEATMSLNEFRGFSAYKPV